MKGKIWYLLALCLVILLAVYIVFFPQKGMNFKESTVSLNHHTEIKFPADSVQITMGVNEKGDDLNELIKSGERKMEEIKSYLEEQDNLSYNTVDYQVKPLPEDNKKDEVENVNYLVQHLININYEKPEKSGEIIKKVVDIGANYISSLEYQLTNSEKARNKAIKKALTELEAKADNTANNLGYNEYHLEELDINDNFNQRIIPLGAGQEQSEKMMSQTKTEEITFMVDLRAKFIFY
ncbi:MAG: SIMPL domain-containing protein [Halanaerobiales bacterium]